MAIGKWEADSQDTVLKMVITEKKHPASPNESCPLPASVPPWAGPQAWYYFRFPHLVSSQGCPPSLSHGGYWPPW